jgi:hypothetical protein
MFYKVKKLLAIVSILIYSITAMGGVTLNFHYCHGQLAKVSFLNFGGQKGCGCNPNDMPKGCCKDEFKYQKSDNHRTIQPAQIAESISVPDVPPACNNYFEISLIDQDNSSLINNEVQRSCREPIYLLNKVFRI